VDNQKIILKKVRVHNLKSIDVELDPQQFIVFSGVSGSGKSSLAFDTLYVEGQRRYVESLSSFARRQIGELIKPDLEYASGISPTISIEQKTAGRNPRSTVGTMTEIYDYMRVLYARVGVPHCPISGEAVLPQSKERIIKTVQSITPKTKIILLAPYAKGKKAEFKEDFQELQRKGFMRVRVDGQFRNLDEVITLDGNLSHDVDVVIDRIVVNAENSSRITESLTLALDMGQGVCSVFYPDTNEEQLLSMHAYSPKSGLYYDSLEPHDFSFNSPSGMCPRCHGMGRVKEFDLEKILDPNKSISEDCCSVGSSYETVRYSNIYNNLAEKYGFSVKTPWKKLSEEAKRIFLYGTEDGKWMRMRFVHPVTHATWIDMVQWKGVINEAQSRYVEAKSDSYHHKMDQLMTDQICPECKGERLKPYPAATLLNGKRITQVTQMTVAEALSFFQSLKLTDTDLKIAEELLKEIIQRLIFLQEVGLHYLTLDRTAPTLSGGEAQRVRLASQIGCGLVGITYILDEPSIGLHPRDNKKLISTLKHLRDMGNTVIVVEHDEETILEADRILDFGPGPGSRGGQIISDGSLKDLIKNKKSLTANYITGRMKIPVRPTPRKPKKETLEVVGATHHNLKNVDVKIPLGVFIAVTGVSGSGKSSLISDILFPALSNHLHGGQQPIGKHKAIKGIENIDKVIEIDQSPIGRNPRSNPATYIKLFDDIRNLFTQLPESKARGYKAGRFSFNVKEGSCPQCHGMGMIKVDMDFMEDAWVECSLCHGNRFDKETLSVLYKEKNIYDILEMEVVEALSFFENIPNIKNKLETLKKVGMEYIKLGQSSTTLSGGEAQRIKLAKELVRPSTGNTLYIFDEPTTGLHFHDVKHLLDVLHELVDRGNTVLVIEHNMDVVKTADWIIDLGPEGGEGGGQIIAADIPEKISKMKTPTGQAVYVALYESPEERIQEALKAKEKKPKKKASTELKEIVIHGAQQNNLKHLDLVIPRKQITVCSGPSGSGKSSLAFETVYAEGQRRYIESLSPYARQFVKQMPKPKVTHVEGLSPAIAIEQKAHAGNPRSTVGTMTEVYDYLRILYARLGIAHDPETGEEIKAISKDLVVERVLTYNPNEKIQVLAPIEIRKNDSFLDILTRFKRQGFLRIRLNGDFFEIEEPEKIPYDRKRKNELMLVIDRLKVAPDIKHRLFEAIESAAKVGQNKVVIMRESGDIFFNLSFAVESTGKSYPEVTPHTFAFNVPQGMCLECLGLGNQYGANLTQKPEIMNMTVYDLIIMLWAGYRYELATEMLIAFLNAENISPEDRLNALTPKQRQAVMNGSEEKMYKFSKGIKFRWIGINNVLTRAARNAKYHIREEVTPLLDESLCPSCEGARINPLARAVTINKIPIQDLCEQPIENALDFIQKIKLKEQDVKLLDEVKTQLINRLSFMCQVGLNYLSLNRSAPTLSGGESQRIRLARQLGSGLTGVLYVLDEPTIGLHPRDNDRLNQALKQLKDLGNTLLMVEHDPLTIHTADYILDFGPQAGEHGGQITARGTIDQIKKNPRSLTGQYLTGKMKIEIPKKRRKPSNGYIEVSHAKLHNLKDISPKFPVGLITALTGVSGSGKSTLLHDILLPAVEKALMTKEDKVTLNGTTIKGLEHFEKVISIDQNPIGQTARSDVATYTEVFDAMRQFFASLPDAKIRGLQGKHFSYNHRAGMCTKCWGLGYRKIEMSFLPAVKVVCEECKGLRLNPLSLEVKYNEKNLGQYLQTTVEDARNVFKNFPKITRILDTLINVGLGYLKLGQEMNSLSGGEAQRIKLSRELSKRSSGKTLYLMDEPTTGLHPDDISKLLKVLQQLTDKGNTMIIIEHNMDMIKSADYVIELGPDAGSKGGYIVASGEPEKIVKTKGSPTATYLKEYL
jgi:excinuclease ABC subunit A